MAKTDPQAAAQKWMTRLSGATAEITAGVNAVQQAPGIAAANARQKWLQKLNASADKWARNVAGVSLASWQQSMTSVGIARVAQGAQAKVGKMQAFLTDFLPYVERGAQQVRAMPSLTVEDGIARAAAMIRHNAAYKKPANA